jgi:hypothetical protein
MQRLSLTVSKRLNTSLGQSAMDTVPPSPTTSTTDTRAAQNGASPTALITNTYFVQIRSDWIILPTAFARNPATQRISHLEISCSSLETGISITIHRALHGDPQKPVRYMK